MRIELADREKFRLLAHAVIAATNESLNKIQSEKPWSPTKWWHHFLFKENFVEMMRWEYRKIDVKEDRSLAMDLAIALETAGTGTVTLSAEELNSLLFYKPSFKGTVVAQDINHVYPHELKPLETNG